MKVAPKWIGVGIGAVAGLITGVVLGTTVFGDDEPRTNLVAVTLPSTTTSTVAPTTTVADEPLAAAPSDTATSALTFAECDTFVDSGPDLPVALCNQSDTVRLVQNLLSANGFDVIPDGKFGPSTAEAVVAFQRSVELTPDGIVDAFTFRALCDGSAVDICVTG
jgi:peptidoglycan hydrolase-like protein with peptidoglycan-binding domain